MRAHQPGGGAGASAPQVAASITGPPLSPTSRRRSNKRSLEFERRRARRHPPKNAPLHVDIRTIRGGFSVHARDVHVGLQRGGVGERSSGHASPQRRPWASDKRVANTPLSTRFETLTALPPDLLYVDLRVIHTGAMIHGFSAHRPLNATSSRHWVGVALVDSREPSPWRTIASIAVTVPSRL